MAQGVFWHTHLSQFGPCLTTVSICTCTCSWFIACPVENCIYTCTCIKGIIIIIIIFTRKYTHFSSQGKEFIKTSSSHSGKSSKICKPYSLCLPKTYVTRRGQMVLFTAPEDMIIGKGYEVGNVEDQHDKVRLTYNTLH